MPINSFLYPAPSTPIFAYNVANSCRFEDGDSPKMTITQGNPTEPGGNASRKWTISTWVKRGNLGINSYIFLGGAYTNQGNKLYFDSNDNLVYWEHNSSSTTSWKFVTNRKFRDCSAWYSIIVAHDSTQGTEGNRVKIYINGTQETSFSTETYPSEDADSNFMYNAEVITIGAQHTQNYFDGYLAETVFIDGSQLAATSFGEFDEDSPTIWKPIDVSGLTFGTNGFYLDFEDSSNLGNDANGGTDLTEVNLAATDQSSDSPTNNYATLNPLALPSSANTFSEGNLIITNSADANRTSFSTIGVSGGKWYCEAKFLSGEMKQYIGISKEEAVTRIGESANSYGFAGENARKWNNDSYGSYGSTASTGDIIMVAFDADNGTIWVGKNGTWFASATEAEIEAGTTTNAMYSSITINDFFFIGASVEDSNIEMNFGNPPYAISSGNSDANGYGNFEYSVPSGYYALCTKNLAEFG